MSQTIHLSLHLGGSPPNPFQVVASSSSSPTRMRKLGGKDQSRSNIANTGVRIAGPEEREPHHIQVYHPPSLAPPGHLRSSSNEAEMNRLDEVGPRAVELGSPLTIGSGSEARLH